MPLYLSMGIIAVSIVAMDIAWACRRVEEHGGASCRFWYIVVVGSIADIVVGLTIGALTAIVILRGKFASDLYLDVIWVSLRHSRNAVIVVVCAVAVLGGVLWRRLLIQGMKMPRRFVLGLLVCLPAAILLHLCFVERGSGVYRNGGPPGEAWFGVIGEKYPFSVPENLSGQAYEQYLLRTAGFKTGELVAHCIWFGPRFPSVKRNDLLCFAGGIIVPAVLLGTAVLSLARRPKEPTI
ncbi:MAG TPA: hypothetical protein HPP83_10605 [Candidatus Hydrogenedentes bacterium]|nr:hypothetical protein [Candidatus Hydrogenedentota bacterium]